MKVQRSGTIIEAIASNIGPIKSSGDSVTVKPEGMEVGRPYVVAFAGQYLIAEKKDDGSVDFFHWSAAREPNRPQGSDT